MAGLIQLNSMVGCIRVRVRSQMFGSGVRKGNLLSRESNLARDELPSSPPIVQDELALFARQLHRERRLRDRLLSSDLFGEPAWDMLLDLYASHGEGRQVSVTSVCLAAAVPVTTALGHLKHLESLQWIFRVSTSDRRVSGIRLTPPAHARIRDLLAQIYQSRRAADPGHRWPSRDTLPPGTS